MRPDRLQAITHSSPTDPPPPPNNYDQQAQLPTPPGLDTNDGLGKRSTCSIKKRQLRPHVSHPAIIAMMGKSTHAKLKKLERETPTGGAAGGR